MKLVLVTGMSGAGKSVALKTLEDSGFEAIDNVPLAYLSDIAASGARMNNLVMAVDIRSRDFTAAKFIKQIHGLRKKTDIDFSLLYLDSDDEALRRRYTETRRRHPLSEDRTVMDGISHERALIEELREEADFVLDTSETSASDLKRIISQQFGDVDKHLSIAVTSFSFRRGVPREADMVFDVRFLRNPHYDPVLKEKTGMDADVGAYIQEDVDYAAFEKRLQEFVLPLLPRYKDEGKHYLTIAIGCTGGQHRSVFITEQLAEMLHEEGYDVTIRHRDVVTIT